MDRMDDLWRIDAHFADWIKHAETKLSILLTSSVAASAVLVSLLKYATSPSVDACPMVKGVILVANGLVLIAALVAAYGIAPRFTGQDAPSSVNLYFYGSSNDSSYLDKLQNLPNPERQEMLANQVVSLGKIASRKFRLAGVATRLLAIGAVLGSIAAIFAMWGS